MKKKTKWFTKGKIILLVFIILIALGYFYYQEKMAMFMRPVVTVAQVEKKDVPIYMDYVGNTAAIKTVDIKARVEGFLIERAFIEGDDVKKGDLMFAIDPKPFEASLAKALAALEKDMAALTYATEQVERYRGLVAKEYITKEDFDNLVTQMEQARAAVLADEADVENAKLDLGYCRMYAPFDGRIGRTLVNVGNLVGAAGQDTKLATIVELDPIYAYFSPSDDEGHKILKAKKSDGVPIEITLTDGTKFSHEGKLDFVNNVVDEATSTVTMRAIIPNPDKLLLPGIYVNVRLDLGTQSDALVAPQQAMIEDQGGQYVMIVGTDEEIRKSYVETGLKYDSDIAITKGLDEGDEVVIDGMQMIKPGMSVNTKTAKKKRGKSFGDVLTRAIFGD